ncbi:MAG: CMP/dCMP deaminase zinc-binding protein [Rickettsiaceae bacterium]|jgi:tRNA(adenine34) deaminase|nr:CMP/dCMP deaminase zinc-binding protein [Rickettsiaceae bacterium]
MFDNQYMRLALELARDAKSQGEVPVGAIIIDKNNNIIAKSFNAVEKTANPLAHAEMLAIEQACSNLGTKYLEDCSLFVNLEPCNMCIAAISFARIKKLYFGAYDRKSGGVESGARFLDSNACHHRPEIYGGILENESEELIKNFFKELRK